MKLPSMGAAVAECGRSLSAWTASSPQNAADRVSLDRVNHGLLTRSCRALIVLFAPAQLRLTCSWLAGGMPGTTRVEAGRRRARAAKRAVTLTAAAGFAVVLALARLGHPAAGTATTRTVQASTGSPSSSATRQDGSSLGGGSLAPSAGGSPPAATHSS